MFKKMRDNCRQTNAVVFSVRDICQRECLESLAEDSDDRKLQILRILSYTTTFFIDSYERNVHIEDIVQNFCMLKWLYN